MPTRSPCPTPSPGPAAPWARSRRGMAAGAALGIMMLGISACGTRASDAAPPPAPIASLDVPRYMGVWHEVAKYPNRFQKQCVGETTATYSVESAGSAGEGGAGEGGRVRVVNRCRLADGRMDEAVGTARQIGGPDSPRLKVRFAPWWLSWLPAVWGDYWVIDLDADYTLVAISDPTRTYLWVLSRTPTPDPTAYQALRTRLHDRGFDLSRLEEDPR